jgi:hypothetical protein
MQKLQHFSQVVYDNVAYALDQAIARAIVLPSFDAAHATHYQYIDCLETRGMVWVPPPIHSPRLDILDPLPRDQVFEIGH